MLYRISDKTYHL